MGQATGESETEVRRGDGRVELGTRSGGLADQGREIRPWRRGKAGKIKGETLFFVNSPIRTGPTPDLDHSRTEKVIKGHHQW